MTSLVSYKSRMPILIAHIFPIHANVTSSSIMHMPGVSVNGLIIAPHHTKGSLRFKANYKILSTFKVLKGRKHYKINSQKNTTHTKFLTGIDSIAGITKKKHTHNLQRTKTKVAYPGAPLNSGSPQ